MRDAHRGAGMLLLMVAVDVATMQVYTRCFGTPLQSLATLAADVAIGAASTYRGEMGLAAAREVQQASSVDLLEISLPGLQLLACIVIDALVPNRKQVLKYGKTQLGQAKEVLTWLPGCLKQWSKPDCLRHPWPRDTTIAFLKGMAANCSAGECTDVYNTVVRLKNSSFSSAVALHDQFRVERALYTLFSAAGKGGWLQ